MMINNKNCSLIMLLLVLVALPKSSESLFSRLNKRATDDGVCQHSTAIFCSKVILDENGLMKRFSPDTSKQIQNHFENATTNCKVLLCMMTMYAVLIEGEKYFLGSPLINDEIFINVIKSSNLIECYDNKNNPSSNDSQSELIKIYNSTIVDYDKLDSTGSTVDFNHLETTVTAEDTQSIKTNEIDGSLNESKHEPRNGIIDILYTNENYTDATKSKDMNEQTDTKLEKDNPSKEYVSVVNLDNMETKINESTAPFSEDFDDDHSSVPQIDVANRILDVIRTTSQSDTAATLDIDLVYVSSISTTTTIPNDETELTSTAVSLNSGFASHSDDMSGAEAGQYNEKINSSQKSSSSSSATTTTKSALSQVGNIIFQLLGEEGYNSFSCNLTTGSEDDSINENGQSVFPHRRLNNPADQTDQKTSNNTFERIEFQPVDSNSFPKFPQNLYDDQQIKFLLLKFNISELCNFTSNDYQNWTENVSTKLSVCSNVITKIKLQMDGRTRIILEKYSRDLQNAAKKLKLIQESKMKIIKIINLTDYLSSTIEESKIPKDLQSNFYELKQFLLVELKNEDLSSFHPDSNRKDVFMVQLFDYLMQSKAVDNKKKKLLEMFKKYIRGSF